MPPPSAVTTFCCHHVVGPLGSPPSVSQVRLPDSPEQQPVSCAIVVAAAGAWTGKLLDSATAGLQGSLTLRRLPIEPRKRSGAGTEFGRFEPQSTFLCHGVGHGDVPTGTSMCGTAPAGRAWRHRSSSTPREPISGARASLATTWGA